MTATGAPFELLTVETSEGALPVVRRGPPAAPAVLILQPLFEESNRCRRFLADLGRELAAVGIASILPDLPGMGDCEMPLGEDGAQQWDRAAAALAPECVAIIAMRGGCLIASEGTTRFHAAPVKDGRSVFRDMMRAQAIADMEATGAHVDVAYYSKRLDAGETVRLAGYVITPELYRTLASRAPPQAVTIDFNAAPIWRQAEPVRAAAEARRIAETIAEGLRK